jgi:pyruvate dehydrogenase (quinone)/pyruvate oxidase
MPETASDALVDRLVAWGVDVVFGLPGDGINGVMEALRRRQDRIRFVQVRHEEAAAFMACGYAKFTSKLGVCLATTGPGAIHLLNGLYDAKLDQAPVLALTGMTYHDLIGTHYQQDVNTDYLFQDVAVYDQRVMGAAHVPNVVDLAIRTALARRGVSHLTIPIDVQHQPAHKDPRSERNVPGHTAPRLPPPERIPVPSALESAAIALTGKRKAVILAGAGARGASDELEQVAERLAAPIVKPLLGKDAVPDDSPYTTGGIGLLGTRPSQEALEECDALLMVGTSFPYTEYLPKPGQAVAVQIDDDPARIGLRYPVEVGLAGDARATLRALLPLLPANSDRTFLSEAQAGMRGWWDLMRERGSRADMPMKPQVVSWNLGQLLRDDAIIAADTGTVTTFAARQIPIRRGQRFSASGTLASMANALPYAIGAQVAYPDRQCVAFVGDGGFSMLMAEFATCVKEKLPVKVVLIKNHVLGMIRWEQMVFLGNPEYGVELSPIDFATFAEACGGRGVRIEDPRRCHQQLEDALSADGPVLIEAVVDPFEPPLPPKVKPEQAAHLAEALARGEPNSERIGLTLFRDIVDETKLPASPVGGPARVVEKISSPLRKSN